MSGKRRVFTNPSGKDCFPLVFGNHVVGHMKIRIHPRFWGENREGTMKLEVDVFSLRS